MKHLRILYGCDDRFDLTTRTVRVCRPYFDSIRILNSGPPEFRDRLQKAVGDIEVTQLHQFFEIESCRRAQIKDIPWNDWVMWLDADETPSPQLLLNLDDHVSFCEKNNKDVILYYWSELTEGVHYPPSIIPQSDEEYHANPTVFAAHRFIKKKPGIRLLSSFGAHEMFQNVNEKEIYMPYAVHHHKSHLQYYQSVTFSGFMNPSVHYDCNKPLSDVIDTVEYKSLKAFQKKWNTFTSNDLVRKLKIEKDSQYKSELKNLFLSFPSDGSTAKGLGVSHADHCITFKFMRIFAAKYDLDVESPYYPCGKPCCKYGDIQL